MHILLEIPVFFCRCLQLQLFFSLKLRNNRLNIDIFQVLTVLFDFKDILKSAMNPFSQNACLEVELKSIFDK